MQPRQRTRQERPDWDPTSTNPYSGFPKDDRPIVIEQKQGSWRAIRKQEGHPDGGKIIARDLKTRSEAEWFADRERAIVPRTDTTHKTSTRKVFYGFNIPEGGLR